MATKVKRQNENELTYNCHIKLHSLIPFNKMTPRVSIPHRFPRYTAPPSPSKPPYTSPSLPAQYPPTPRHHRPSPTHSSPPPSSQHTTPLQIPLVPSHPSLPAS